MPRPRHRSHRRQTALLVAASIVVVAVVAVLLANAAGHSSRPRPRASTPSTSSPPSALRLVLGPLHMQNVGPPATVPLAVRHTLLATAQSYVDDAILTPLKTGRVDDGYERMFDGGVQADAKGPDRAVLTEAATGVARGAVRATASPVVLDGLGDPSGKPALIAATFVLTVRAPLARGPLTVQRLTELTFADYFGHWLVTAYNVGVRRTIGATTTAKAATTARDASGIAA